MSREGQGKVKTIKTRSKQGQGEVKARIRSGQGNASTTAI